MNTFEIFIDKKPALVLIDLDSHRGIVFSSDHIADQYPTAPAFDRQYQFGPPVRCVRAFVSLNLNLGGTVFLNRNLYMEGIESGEADSDRYRYFYDNKSGTDEYLRRMKPKTRTCSASSSKAPSLWLTN